MATHRVEHGLYVREGGRGHRPIVYLHGLGESALCFERLIDDPLLEEWRHYALDLPGYGKTPWSDRPLGLEDLAARVVSWMHAKQLRNVVLVGHSMGGVVGIEACKRSSGLVRAFLNVEGNVSADDCVFSGEIVGHAPDRFPEDGFHRVLRRLFDAGVKDPSLRGYYASMRMCDPRQLRVNSAELIEVSTSGDLARQMAVLPLPVRYFAGVPDGTSLNSRQLLAEAGVPCVAIQNAGHWPFMDQPGAFADAFRAFLEDHQ